MKRKKGKKREGRIFIFIQLLEMHVISFYFNKNKKLYKMKQSKNALTHKM